MKTQKKLPLEWATMDEIADELQRRTHGFVLVYAKATPGQEDRCQYPILWCGGIVTAYGLACHARNVLYNRVKALALQGGDED